MDAGPLHETPADDPIDVLLGEHRTILQVLDGVERECRRLEQRGVLREVFWRDVLHFADAFDATLHHHKEAVLLFPALERAGLSPTAGPTAVLRDEHRRTTFWQQRMEQALLARDQTRLLAAAGSYFDLVQSHVLKENQILFPLVRRLLTAAELTELGRQFRGYVADPRVPHWLPHPYALEA
jgi:hemerythrin-like domain-containing protein